MGFALLCISLLIQSAKRDSGQLNPVSASLAVIVLALASGSAAVGIRQHGQLAETVINQTLAAIQNDWQSIVIRDTTGILGDVYTLLGSANTLSEAIAVHGRRNPATICTPLSVDRLHPDAQRYPIPSTPRCEELPAMPNNTTLVLTARWNNGILTIEP